MRFGSTVQTSWDWRAAGNFMFGGTGSALILLFAVTFFPGNPSIVLSFVALAIVGLGLFLVWLEIGRPKRFLHVFFNPKTSWMTREAFVAVLLFALVFLNVVTRQPVFMWLAGLSGLAFLYCQARMLRASKGIPAWRLQAIMPLITVTGLCEGASLLFLLLMAMGGGPVWLAYLILVLGAARALAWRHYTTKLPEENAPQAAVDVVNGINWIVLLFGSALPVLLILLPYAGLNALAAVLALLAGWFMKFTIVTKASYNQGYAISTPR